MEMSGLEGLFAKHENLWIFQEKAACLGYVQGLFPISSSLTCPPTACLITDYAKAVNAGLLFHTANLSQNSLPWLTNGIHLG